MALVRLRGPLKALAGGAELPVAGATVAELLARAGARAAGAARLDPRRARPDPPPHQRLRQRREGRRGHGDRARRPRRRAPRDLRRMRVTELLVGTKKGLFVLEGEPGAPFEVTARAFAGEPVEYAMRDPRTNRILAGVISPFYGPKIFVAEDAERRVGAGQGRRAARGRRGGARADLGDRARRGRRRAVRRRRPRRAVQDHRRRADAGSSCAACSSIPTRPDWTPGGGGLCLHSIAPWPGEPDKLALALSAVGVWLTDDGGETWRHGNQGLGARYLPEEKQEETLALCVHDLQRAPKRPERMFIQFHGGVYRSDDAGEIVDRDRRRAAVGLRLPARRRPRRPRQRLRDPAEGRHGPRHARGPRARLRDPRRGGDVGAARRRPAGRARLPDRAARGVRPPRRGRARSSSTSARPRATSSAPPTPARPGSAPRPTSRRSTRVRTRLEVPPDLAQELLARQLRHDDPADAPQRVRAGRACPRAGTRRGSRR